MTADRPDIETIRIALTWIPLNRRLEPIEALDSLAARVEALEAEKADLIFRDKETQAIYVDQLEDARARVEALEAALREIDEIAGQFHWSPQMRIGKILDLRRAALSVGDEYPADNRIDPYSADGPAPGGGALSVGDGETR